MRRDDEIFIEDMSEYMMNENIWKGMCILNQWK